MNCKMSAGVLPGTSVNAYPNPVSTTLNVELDAMSAGVYSIELMDVSGRVVYVTSIAAVNGFNFSTLDVAEFAKGVYTLSVIKCRRICKTNSCCSAIKLNAKF